MAYIAIAVAGLAFSAMVCWAAAGRQECGVSVEYSVPKKNVAVGIIPPVVAFGAFIFIESNDGAAGVLLPSYETAYNLNKGSPCFSPEPAATCWRPSPAACSPSGWAAG